MVSVKAAIFTINFRYYDTIWPTSYRSRRARGTCGKHLAGHGTADCDTQPAARGLWGQLLDTRKNCQGGGGGSCRFAAETPQARAERECGWEWEWECKWKWKWDCERD